MAFLLAFGMPNMARAHEPLPYTSMPWIFHDYL